MGSKQQMIKLFIVLLINTSIVFGFSHFAAQAFENVTKAVGKFPNGTFIGFIDVSGKTKVDAASLLEESYIDWMKSTKITLYYQEKSASFDLDKYVLNAKQTVSSMKGGEKNPADIMIDKAKVTEQLQLLFPEVNIDDFNVDKLTADLTQIASKYETGSYSLDLYNHYLHAGVAKKDEVVGKAVLSLNVIPNDLLDKPVKIQIPANTTFSLLSYVKQQQLQLDPTSLNILAAGIYQLVLPTNFTFAERNISSVLPNYAQLGREAMVDSENNSDLRFKNGNSGNYSIELQLINNHLLLSLTGEKFLYSYKISVETEQKFAPKTVVQYSPLLLPGKTFVKTAGKDGQMAKVYRQIYQGDQFLKSEVISEDYYPPVYRVEIHGLIGSNSTSQITGNTTTGPSIEQSGTNTATNKTVTQTRASTDDVQPVSNQTDLWGKPNEQPK